MFAALARAFADLSAPPMRRVVGLGLGLTVASFILLWLAVALALDRLVRFAWQPLDWAVQLLGAAGVLVVSWLLFPAVATLIMGLFLDRIAAAVEALDYPALAPPRRRPASEGLAVTLRMMGLSIALNLLALPVYLLAPGANFFVFLSLNGYLFGREYFEVVALRRLDRQAVAAVRRRFGGRVFLGGVVIAGLFLLPLVNLLAPAIATAFMVHVFVRLPEPRAVAP
jgi:uncharacterized protein involved in cysteine biosynthesis